MNGRKYIGEIVFDQNIDQYSKSKKESLKREIYDKMVSNEYFIKNIELGVGQFLSHKNKTIKLKGDKAFVEFKETVSIFNDTYKKRNKDKSMFNWAQKNFKRSMNFNKKMFLDDSLKAVKVSVKKDIKGGMDLSGIVEKKPENIIIKGEGGDIPVSNAPEWLSRRLIRQNAKIETIPDKKVEKDELESEETKTKTKTKSNSGPKKTITKSKARLKSKNKRYKKNKKGKSKKIKSKNKI